MTDQIADGNMDRAGASYRSRSKHRLPIISDISAARWLLLLILSAAVYFFHGFLVPTLAAMIISFASWPIYMRLKLYLKISSVTAAIIFTAIIVVFIVAPLAIAVTYAIGELKVWVFWLFATNAAGASTPEWLGSLPHVGAWLDEQWVHFIGRPGAIADFLQLTAGTSITSVYWSVLAAGNLAIHVLFNLLFMMITLFVFYKDGDKIAAQLDAVGSRILPSRWQRLSRVVPMTISSTVTGMTLIAVGEGVILGVAYWVAGVPSPAALGILTGFMALIPGGAPLAFTLVSIYLGASGSMTAGILLFFWGSIELFIVDKTIRPLLVGGPVKMPFLPTIFGLVGGVQTMGIIGLFVGPVLMALLVAIWREWVRETRELVIRGEALADISAD